MNRTMVQIKLGTEKGFGVNTKGRMALQLIENDRNNIEIFSYEGLWLYDQSTNVSTFRDKALWASRETLNPKV